VQTVAQASTDDSGVNWSDTAIAVIVAWDCVVEDADSCDLAAVETEADDRVSVLCFSAVSVVHKLVCTPDTKTASLQFGLRGSEFVLEFGDVRGLDCSLHLRLNLLRRLPKEPI